MSNLTISAHDQAAALAQQLRGTDFDGLIQQPGGAPNADGASPIDGFADTLAGQVEQVNDVMVAADDKTQAFLTGEETSIHEVMIAMTKADVSFRLMTQIGRRVLEAYQEINRMQV